MKYCVVGNKLLLVSSRCTSLIAHRCFLHTGVGRRRKNLGLFVIRGAEMKKRNGCEVFAHKQLFKAGHLVNLSTSSCCCIGLDWTKHFFSVMKLTRLPCSLCFAATNTPTAVCVSVFGDPGRVEKY